MPFACRSGTLVVGRSFEGISGKERSTKSCKRSPVSKSSNRAEMTKSWLMSFLSSVTLLVGVHCSMGQEDIELGLVTDCSISTDSSFEIGRRGTAFGDHGDTACVGSG